MLVLAILLAGWGSAHDPTRIVTILQIATDQGPSLVRLTAFNIVGQPARAFILEAGSRADANAPGGRPGLRQRPRPASTRA
jgi:hypothetical protein